MALDNAAREELQNSVSFAPITPAKCLNKFVLVNSSGAKDMELDNAAKEDSVSCAPITPEKWLNKFVLVNSSDSSTKGDDALPAAIKEGSKNLDENLDFDSMAPLTPPQKANPKRKQSDSSDLNDGPCKKQRTRKKITPKIFDESKPKKIPKTKKKPSTPRPPGNHNASISAKRNTKKDSYKASKEISERSIGATSPLEFEQNIRTDSGHDVKSCRRALDFNLENQNDVISDVIFEGGTEHIRDHIDHIADSLNEFLTNPFKDVNKEPVGAAKVPNHPLVTNLVVMNDSSTVSLENKLEAESTSQPNRGNQNNYGVRQHQFLKVYQRRTKTNIGMMSGGRGNIGAMSLVGNKAGIYQNDPEYECLSHSRKLTLNFPITCKKTRTARRKALVPHYLSAHWVDKGFNSFNTHKTCKVSSRAKGIYGRGGAKKAMKRRFTVSKRTKKRRLTLGKGAQKRSFTYATRATKRRITTASGAKRICFSTLTLGHKEKLKPVLPTKFQITSAMADPESFQCLFALSPMLKSRRKRSIRPKRTKCVCEEEDTNLEAISFASLPPLVISKRKRSTNKRVSTAVLDPLCLKSESSVHEESCCNTESGDKSHPPTLTKASMADSMAHACIPNSFCPSPETNAINRDGSFTDKSAWDVIPKRPKHKELWPRADGLTDFEWWLASVTQRLKKLQSRNRRTYRRKVMSMKKNGNNASQLVLRNRSGPIVNSNNKPLKAKLPKVDIDSESLRVWKLLIENEGEPDEDLDKEKETWWEEQRKIFQGRVDSFIARMRLVLGDRRFSQWNGSVVDSVVGVYLTQNVSDFLSSNAFMLLASAFPPKPKQESTTREGRTLTIHEKLHGIQEVKDSGGEVTCESVARVPSCGSEVITSAKIDDIGSEKIKLPEKISREDSSKGKTDWDELRKTYSTGRLVTEKNRDSVDWEAVRLADIEKIVEPIKSRGQHVILAKKIKDFLNRMVEDHGSTDIEWLRDVPCEKVKEYLLSIYGLGPKSVDCLRLLTLRHVAFPVDINVARVAVRLGWVPLQPLPDGLQMHLLEKYPLESSIQKYLWPRLCKLDVLTLYELHYHMITFGKVFCTKKSPNCNACPLRAECRHFASAFASARLRLPGPQQQGVVPVEQPIGVYKAPNMSVPSPTLSLSCGSETRFPTQSCEPIIEMPPSPDKKCQDLVVRDIEDFPCEVEYEQEIPAIQFDTEVFRENVLDFIKKSNNKEFYGEEEVSKALVLLSPEAFSFPAPKLKNESRLRTEHLVYELPDSHPLLSGFEKGLAEDHCPYLLSICQTDEVMKNQKNFGKDSSFMESGVCGTEICLSSASCDRNDQIVYGTILIPCRTANRGSFPLNGTYFQVNEVFADHKSSQCLIPVPRASIWNLTQSPLLCGTSVKSIFKGMPIGDTQCCFWRGYVCMRGYDREQRAPRPLHKRFHSGKKN